MKRIALGTAQFGFPYGVSNKIGQTRTEEIERIIHLARSSGLDTLDTSVSYGDSENNLGAVGVADWNVVTKLPALPNHIAGLERWIRETVNGSLKRLHLPSLYGLLLHRPEDIRGRQKLELVRVLAKLKSDGFIRKIGLSAYNPEDLTYLPDSFEMDLVQIPFNILDRRLIRSGLLKKLKMNGVEVHVRSVFLQGLLLMDQTSRPTYFNRWEAVWKAWDLWIANNKVDPLAACLNFALSQVEVDRVIVGTESVDQLNQILVAARTEYPIWPEDLQIEDKNLILPKRWNLK